MNFALLKKDLKILIRNRTVKTSLAVIFLLETAVIIYSGNVITHDTAVLGVQTQFSFIQSHFLISFFPVITVNILFMAFSMPREKNDLMLARLVPYGESMFIRSKISLSVILSSLLSLFYLFASIYYNGLSLFMKFEFISFLFFFYLFSIISMCNFSILFSFRFYEGKNNFEPDLKGILLYMLSLSFLMILILLLLLKLLALYYGFITGFRMDYPNKDLISGIVIVFSLSVLIRIFLKSAEKRSLSGYYPKN